MNALIHAVKFPLVMANFVCIHKRGVKVRKERRGMGKNAKGVSKEGEQEERNWSEKES